MPKERYREYRVERARGGVALTMTAGSAAVSKDSPPVFNNILAYEDEVVSWIRELTDVLPEDASTGGQRPHRFLNVVVGLTDLIHPRGENP